MLLGSSGGWFFSSDFAVSAPLPFVDELVSTGGGGWPSGALGLSDCGFGEVPTTGDLSGSVCARKEDAHKKMRAISGIALSIRQETAKPVIVQFLP
jgi:hypothetical protein